MCPDNDGFNNCFNYTLLQRLNSTKLLYSFPSCFKILSYKKVTDII